MSLAGQTVTAISQGGRLLPQPGARHLLDRPGGRWSSLLHRRQSPASAATPTKACYLYPANTTCTVYVQVHAHMSSPPVLSLPREHALCDPFINQRSGISSCQNTTPRPQATGRGLLGRRGEAVARRVDVDAVIPTYGTAIQVNSRLPGHSDSARYGHERSHTAPDAISAAWS